MSSLHSINEYLALVIKNYAKIYIKVFWSFPIPLILFSLFQYILEKIIDWSVHYIVDIPTEVLHFSSLICGKISFCDKFPSWSFNFSIFVVFVWVYISSNLKVEAYSPPKNPQISCTRIKAKNLRFSYVFRRGWNKTLVENGLGTLPIYLCYERKLVFW